MKIYMLVCHYDLYCLRAFFCAHKDFPVGEDGRVGWHAMGSRIMKMKDNRKSKYGILVPILNFSPNFAFSTQSLSWQLRNVQLVDF